MSFFSKTRIKATELFEDSYLYLQRTYDQAKSVFTPSSPFGQVLTVVSNMGELIMFYVEAASTELNIAQARNIESIYGLSRLTGHNPTRGISAIGMIGLRLNANAATLVEGDFVDIAQGTRVQIENNGYKYLLKFDSPYIRLQKTSREWVNVEILQGEIEEQTFSGTGTSLQSFSLTTKSATDNFNIKVKVDGQNFELVESLYDMNYNETKCMVMTGMNGGLDIFFGNNQFGKIPPLGAVIKVEYLKTNGSNGNIGGKGLKFKFLDPGADFLGQDVDLAEVLQVNVLRSPNFGSNTEDPDFTRLIAPYSSRSFVLANPNNYIYYLSKYDFFSFIDAYNTKDDEYIADDNIIYLFLIPDIKKKLTSDKTWFTVPIEEFSLDAEEKEMVLDILNESGRQVVTAEVRIKDPIIKKYALNIVLRYFENADKGAMDADIQNQLNQYFLNVQRRDRVPRSDLISIIENVEGVDSVNVFFISEENEKAIRDGYYTVPVYRMDPATDQMQLIEEKKIELKTGPDGKVTEDPLLGLDDFGDIVINNDELAIIRGGWEDRNGNYYETYPDKNKLSSLNIFFKASIPNDLYSKTQQKNFNNLRRNRGTTIADGKNSPGQNTGRLEGTPTQKSISGQVNKNN
jgi:hypothetical protein|tara:strand:+ start:50 stop:1939 length:1890 start_codon:yes stop_codon:yes gene_type:complete